MNYEKKKQLIALLNMYENEVLETDSRLKKGNKYDSTYNGNKAKLNHIRILRNRLSLEVSNEIYD